MLFCSVDQPVNSSSRLTFEETAQIPDSKWWRFSSPGAEAFLTALLLVLATMGLYQRSLRNGFTNYDDPTYVTENPHVRQGLSLRNIAWAFHSNVDSNVAGHWHPLTVISQMADVQMFGLNPAGHHFDSVLLHALNVLMLFLLLRSATGFLGRSAVVAGLFAFSPLNVEAVDWVAERKAVLCTAFFFLTLFAYGAYARRPTMKRYLGVVVFFACGLMSEAMVITLPAVLLLADYWPLNRFSWATLHGTRDRIHTAAKLAIEKIPLFAMSVGSAYMTMRAAREGGATTPLNLFPLNLRLTNAVYSYGVYILKAVWPTHLAVFYPHPGRSLSLWKVIAASVFLLAITAVVWRFRERRYLLVGWLWFLGMMIPVSGIFQAGLQGMADRYTYVPFIGLFVMVVWLFAETAADNRLPRAITISAAFVALALYASVSYAQIGYWRDSYTLFTHAAQVTSRNAVAENGLGNVFENSGQIDQAIEHYETAVQFAPLWCTPHFRLGVMFQAKDRPEDALRQYDRFMATCRDPASAWEAHNNLGIVLAQLNRPDEAIAEFSAAARINPEDPVSLTNRGLTEYHAGQLDAARKDLAHAVQLAPSAERYLWLGRAEEDSGSVAAAAEAYEAALRFSPDSKDAQSRLEIVRGKLRD